MKEVIIFGAGIAGLTAAHELTELGYKVSVYESNSQAGGFFRSDRLKVNNQPTEYSWHGFGPWYHNAFDIMKKIPFQDSTIYNKSLSRPINFGIFPNTDLAKFYHGLRSIPDMFLMNKKDFIKWSYLMLKTWTADRRSVERYSKINAAHAWQPYLQERSFQTWKSCFGPWIGSGWDRVSLHTTGEFFRKQLTTKLKHLHLKDKEGAAWTHGAGDGWLLLKGPSNEYWFDPWVAFLQSRGVTFHWNSPLTKINFDGQRVLSVVANDLEITGDEFIFAINPFYFKEILARSPSLQSVEELNLFNQLTIDAPHNQISFRLSFKEKINLPKERTAVVVSDSEFNLTLFAQEQVWDAGVDLGKGINSLWTGTSCVSTSPGKLYNKSVDQCSKEEFIEEIKAQVFSCEALNELIRKANQGKSLKDFTLLSVEVWHEWDFTQKGAQGLQPKWVNNTINQLAMPPQKTSVPNLYLAGAHTKTAADVWSIEGAVESGKKAAQLIDSRVRVISQSVPGWIKILRRIDNLLWKLKLPHLFDCFFIFLIIELVRWFF